MCFFLGWNSFVSENKMNDVSLLIVWTFCSFSLNCEVFKECVIKTFKKNTKLSAWIKRDFTLLGFWPPRRIGLYLLGCLLFLVALSCVVSFVSHFIFFFRHFSSSWTNFYRLKELANTYYLLHNIKLITFVTQFYCSL